ncbi:hypothetical protein BBP00_00004769 [Phytophthora kernoviae]|uniref:Uncharacterized protein n=1 Tax=Phytophthora kernoviae TaxID=325452 RepID=A0A3F2RQV6_9STRA|nr:hypothetical protein BBP00_00004769 [Phytophthora kernoviae]
MVGVTNLMQHSDLVPISSPSSPYDNEGLHSIKQEEALVSGASPTGSSVNSTLALTSTCDENSLTSGTSLLTAADMDEELFSGFVGQTNSVTDGPSPSWDLYYPPQSPMGFPAGSRAARLSHFVDESLRKVEEMSSGARPSAATMPTMPIVTFNSDLLPFRTEDHSGEDTDGNHSNDTVNLIETDDASSVHTIDPATGYSLSDERKRELLNIAAFVRVNISLESSSFSPEVISCLPIEMDGWQLRLAITEKNYTIHNQKFFPCNAKDMFDFCWETNVAQKISIKHGKKHYVVVTPLDKDVAHVYSKTTGKWSLSVHGVPNVSYNSIVCRRYIPEQERAIICQESVLEERDFQDESTLPWLFKRWVVFRPHVQDGVEGTFVEAYRTASYATGRLIYKENKTYDSFCEHLIRRYAESNSLLERMMARDKRFAHTFDASVRSGGEAESATVSDRMIKDLLLF